MKIALAADHRGVQAAEQLSASLRRQGHEVQIVGELSSEMCDYPDPAYGVGMAVSTKTAERGILLCGSGIGMSIAANKVPGVRAALVHDEFTAEISRSHNDSNVLCISADLLGQRLIETIVDIWLKTEFHEGRHARRVRKIEAIESGTDPRTVD